jgi:hypothetical protein
MPLSALLTSLEIQLRLARPTRQTPIAERCPPGEHAHVGMAYCHPERRKHRVAHSQLHQQHRATENTKQEMERQWNVLTGRAREGKPVSDAMRANFSRIKQYMDMIHGQD